MFFSAVIDVETTGLSPRSDRIIEIAVVGVDPVGNIEWAWSSIVNPHRGVGATKIHGLRARDLVDAPSFSQIAGRVGQLMKGRMVVAHNASFDSRFLLAELERAGISDDVQLPISCTLQQAKALGISPATLADVCAAFGVIQSGVHEARADAIATAQIWAKLLPSFPDEQRFKAAQDIASLPFWEFPVELVDGSPRPDTSTDTDPNAVMLDSGIEAVRVDADMANLDLQMLDLADPRTSYLGAVQRAVEDRSLDRDERAELDALATDLGLDLQREELHLEALRSQAGAAWADGVISQSEHLDLHDMARELGLTADHVDQALAEPRPTQVHPSRLLQPGDRIVFTGDMDRDRDQLKEAAIRKGLRVTSAVSGRTAALVLSDVSSETRKATTAREGNTDTERTRIHAPTR